MSERVAVLVLLIAGCSATVPQPRDGIVIRDTVIQSGGDVIIGSCPDRPDVPHAETLECVHGVWKYPGAESLPGGPAWIMPCHRHMGDPLGAPMHCPSGGSDE